MESLVRETLGSEPVRFVVEAQFLMADYLAMRKDSHIWYKVFRSCDNLMTIHMDFSKFAANRTAQQVVPADDSSGSGGGTLQFTVPEIEARMGMEHK